LASAGTADGAAGGADNGAPSGGLYVEALKLPRLDGMPTGAEGGRVVAWLVPAGAGVAKGTPLAEVTG
jgi:hypothetical protein